MVNPSRKFEQIVGILGGLGTPGVLPFVTTHTFCASLSGPEIYVRCTLFSNSDKIFIEFGS